MSGSDRESLLNAQEALLDVREATRMSRSGQKVLPDVREWSRHPPGCPGGPLRCSGVFGKPSKMSERPSRMSRSGREVLTNVQERLGGPLECPVVVERRLRMSESGREALTDVREWLGNPPGCPGVVGRPSRMSRSGRKASRLFGRGR